MPVFPEQIEEAVRIARSYDATRLVLFGSAARDPEAARDLDLAVAGVPGWALFRLAAELERTLNVPLDLVPLEDDPGFAQHIEEYGKVLYEQRAETDERGAARNEQNAAHRRRASRARS
jgi:predicted nucleotidyltransferase